MLKNSRYLYVLMTLIVLTGCQTVNGSTNGAPPNASYEDMQSTSNPLKDVWACIIKADDWIRKNIW